MMKRTHWLLAPTLLLAACAPKVTSQAALAEPEAGPTDDVPQRDPEPEPVAPLPPAFEPPPAPLAWDKEIERAPLPGSQGTIALGASACESGVRGLLLRREKKGQEAAQTELDFFTGCDFARDGKGWTTTAADEEGRALRLQLSSVALDPKTVAIVLDIQENGGEDRLVLSRGDTLLLVQSGRLSASTTDLVLAQGQLSQVLRSDGSRDFTWHAAYGLTVDAEGGLVSTPRALSMARTQVFADWKEAAPAKEALVASCPKAAGRISLLDVFEEDGESELWLGIPALTYADASAGARELKACGIAASVVTRPAPKDP